MAETLGLDSLVKVGSCNIKRVVGEACWGPYRPLHDFGFLQTSHHVDKACSVLTKLYVPKEYTEGNLLGSQNLCCRPSLFP